MLEEIMTTDDLSDDPQKAYKEEQRQRKIKLENLYESCFKKDGKGDIKPTDSLIDLLRESSEAQKVFAETLNKFRQAEEDSNAQTIYKLQEQLAHDIAKLAETRPIDAQALEQILGKYALEKEGTQESVAEFTEVEYKDSVDLPNDPVLFKPNFLLKGASHLIVGKAGSGKSYLALQIALALIKGTPFLGMECEKKQRVAYISFEDTMPLILNRLKAIGGKKEDGLFIYTDLTPFVISQKGGKHLITAIGKAVAEKIQTREIDTIIIDTYAQAFLHEDGDNSTAQSIGNWLKKTLPGKTIIILHHIRKAEAYGQKDITIDSIRGASALVGYVRSAVCLDAENGMLKSLKCNYGQPFPNYSGELHILKDIAHEDGGKQTFRGFKVDSNMNEQEEEYADGAESCGMSPGFEEAVKAADITGLDD